MAGAFAAGESTWRGLPGTSGGEKGEARRAQRRASLARYSVTRSQQQFRREIKYRKDAAGENTNYIAYSLVLTHRHPRNFIFLHIAILFPI
jgi:hypothetical protein